MKPIGNSATDIVTGPCQRISPISGRTVSTSTCSGAASGITAMSIMAGMNDIVGASRNSQ